MQLEKIQAYLREHELGGWLMADFHARNDIAVSRARSHQPFDPSLFLFYSLGRRTGGVGQPGRGCKVRRVARTHNLIQRLQAA